MKSHLSTPSVFLAIVLFFASTCFGQDDKSVYNDLQQTAAGMPDDLPRFAILIGNANYNEITSLDSPELDVEGMYKVLLNLNFPDENMLLLKNLTKRGMDIEVGRFVKKLSQKCLVVFYYSGHGAQFAIDNTRGASNYLLPVDLPADIADVEIPSYSYDLDNALGLIMRQNPDGPKVFILDACRSNPLSYAKGGSTKGLADIGRFDNAIIGYAAEPGKVACDGGTGHLSPYTETLIEVMQIPGLKLEEVFSDVRKEMIKKEKCYTSSHASILLNDDYYFIPGTPYSPDFNSEALTGTIELTTEIAGTLYIDGQKQEPPLEANTLSRFDYPIGFYTLRIEGSQSWEQRIEVKYKQTTEATARKTQNEYEPEMVLIKGGSFKMGSETGSDDEKPVHGVVLSDFYMGKYEVTVAQFKQFIDATGYQTDADKYGSSYVINSSDSYDSKADVNWKCDATGQTRPKSEYNHPVIHVSWNDATTYCQWLSRKTGKKYQLPTEAQWEYAAGNGAKHTIYSWGNGNPMGNNGGNVADESAKRIFTNWTIFDGYDDGYVYTAPVGSYNANELGLYDMSGNVWEWCEDRYDADFYKTGTQTKNPCNTSPGDYHVLRGGSWSYGRYCHVANRFRDNPVIRFIYGGFRLAQDY